MWIDTPEGRELVTLVSHDLVTQVAPEELDLFDELIADYYANPSPPSRSGSDDPLAFGVEGMLVVATTPAAAAMVTAAISYIATEVFKVVQEESIKSLLTKIRAYFHPKDEAAALTKAQLQQVYNAILVEAAAYDLPPEEVDRLARALVGTLVLSV